MATSSTLHQNDAGVAAEATEPSIPTSQAVSMNEKLSPTDKDPEKTSRQTHPTEEAKNVSNLRYYMRVFSYNDPLGWLLNATAVACMIVSGAILPVMNLLFGKFINQFNEYATGSLSAAEYRKQLSAYALYFVYLFVGKFVLVYGWSVLVSITGIRTVKALRVHFMRQTLRQEMAFFDSPTTSVSSQIVTNGNLISAGISEKLGVIIQAVSTFVAAFVVAFVVQWKLTLITCCVVPLNIAAIGAFVIFDAEKEGRMAEHCGQADALLEEALSSIQTVHAYWAFPKLSKQFAKIIDNAKKIGDSKTLFFTTILPIDAFCIYAAYALAFWRGIHMYVSGEVTEPGTVVTVILVMLIAAQSVPQVLPHIMAITQASAAAKELFSVIDRESALDSLSKTGATISENDLRGDIVLQNVNLSYPSRPYIPILQDLSINIPAGKVTALVGASGSGKSSIVSLIERWYSHTGGTITLDGRPLEDLKLSWLRTVVRLVQQEPTLFSGTIYQNVRDGLTGTRMASLPDVDIRLLVTKACKDAYAHDFIQQLPQGYDTWIGERGGSLSGGQKQRIVIARSIISNPKILLLDEATSALDPQAEKIVQKALANVGQSRTTLVIAHKLSTIRNADNIIVMSEGTVIEQGTHFELLRKVNGTYAKLIASQDLGEMQTSPNDEVDVIEPTDLEETKKESDQKMLDDEAIESASMVQHEPNASIKRSDQEEGGEILAIIDKSVSRGLVSGMLRILSEEKQLRVPVIATITAACLAAATYPGQAVLFAKMLDAFQNKDLHQGNLYALLFFILAVGNYLVYALACWAANTQAQRMMRVFRFELFNITLRQDMTFFNRRENPTGAMASRVSSEATRLQNLISFNLFYILNNVVTIVASSILGIAYGWKLGLVLTFAGLPFLVGSGYVRVRLEYKFDVEASERFAQSSAYASEAIRSIRMVSSLALEQVVAQRYHDSVQNLANQAMESLILRMLFYSLSQSTSFLVMALGFWYGGRLVSTGEYDNYQFYVVFIAVVFSGEAAAALFTYTTSISQAKVAMNYIFTLRKSHKFFDASLGSSGNTGSNSEMSTNVEQQKHHETMTGKEIVLDNVHFEYLQRPDPVLKGLTFKFVPGTMVALVGASGCGKSTVVALLERFYDPTNGEIRTDNAVNIQDIDCCIYRRDVSLVQQEPVLYSGSISENISLGVEQGEPSDDKIIAACKQANIWDFVLSLPDGIHTKCGGQGLSLSGGQRQRVAIARAIIRRPRLLILDEATSALDTESERVVKTALDSAAAGAGRTTVAVAHRLSTIRDADTILVLHNGVVAEVGKHDDLIAKKAMYYEMVQGQSLDRDIKVGERRKDA